MTKSAREKREHIPIRLLPGNHTLDQSLEQLPEEIQPEQDLWPGISRAINRKRASQQNNTGYFATINKNTAVYGMLAGAVVLVCTLVLSIYNTWLLNQLESPAFHQQIDQEFVLARQQLVLDKDNMSEETYRIINRNLHIIRQAKSDIRQALKNDPNNMALMRQLVRVQNEELAVMNNTNMIKKL